MDLKKRLRRSSLIVTIVCSAISVLVVAASFFIGTSQAGFWLSEIDAVESRSFFTELSLERAGYDLLSADEIRINMQIGYIVVGATALGTLWVIWNPFREFLLFLIRKPVLNILWLRKFNSDPKRSKFWVSDAIENCRLEYYKTITLADQQFHFSDSNLKHGRNGRLLGVFSFSVLFSISAGLSVFVVHINVIWGGIVVATLWSTLILLFIYTRRVLQREKENRERALNIDIEPMSIQEINSHFESAPPSDRVFVYRARDDEWQDVVKSFIIKSDIVLIDISNLSENMRWELEQLVCLKGPDRIILLSDTPFGSKEALIDFVPDFAKKLLDVDDKYLHVMVYSTSGYRADARAKRFSKAMSQVIYRLARKTPSSQETPAL